MKIRAQEYRNSNLIGKRIYELRIERNIKQKEFIAQL